MSLTGHAWHHRANALTHGESYALGKAQTRLDQIQGGTHTEAEEIFALPPAPMFCSPEECCDFCLGALRKVLESVPVPTSETLRHFQGADILKQLKVVFLNIRPWFLEKNSTARPLGENVGTVPLYVMDPGNPQYKLLNEFASGDSSAGKEAVVVGMERIPEIFAACALCCHLVKVADAIVERQESRTQHRPSKINTQQCQLEMSFRQSLGCNEAMETLIGAKLSRHVRTLLQLYEIEDFTALQDVIEKQRDLFVEIGSHLQPLFTNEPCNGKKDAVARLRTFMYCCIGSICKSMQEKGITNMGGVGYLLNTRISSILREKITPIALSIWNKKKRPEHDADVEVQAMRDRAARTYALSLQLQFPDGNSECLATVARNRVESGHETAKMMLSITAALDPFRTRIANHFEMNNEQRRQLVGEVFDAFDAQFPAEHISSFSSNQLQELFRGIAVALREVSPNFGYNPNQYQYNQADDFRRSVLYTLMRELESRHPDFYPAMQTLLRSIHHPTGSWTEGAYNQMRLVADDLSAGILSQTENQKAMDVNAGLKAMYPSGSVDQRPWPQVMERFGIRQFTHIRREPGTDRNIYLDFLYDNIAIGRTVNAENDDVDNMMSTSTSLFTRGNQIRISLDGDVSRPLAGNIPAARSPALRKRNEEISRLTALHTESALRELRTMCPQLFSNDALARKYGKTIFHSSDAVYIFFFAGQQQEFMQQTGHIELSSDETAKILDEMGRRWGSQDPQWKNHYVGFRLPTPGQLAEQFFANADIPGRFMEGHDVTEPPTPPAVPITPGGGGVPNGPTEHSEFVPRLRAVRDACLIKRCKATFTWDNGGKIETENPGPMPELKEGHYVVVTTDRGVRFLVSNDPSKGLLVIRNTETDATAFAGEVDRHDVEEQHGATSIRYHDEDQFMRAVLNAIPVLGQPVRSIYPINVRGRFATPLDTFPNAPASTPMSGDSLPFVSEEHVHVPLTVEQMERERRRDVGDVPKSRAMHLQRVSVPWDRSRNESVPSQSVLLLRADFADHARRLNKEPWQLTVKDFSNIKSGTYEWSLGGNACGDAFLDRLAREFLLAREYRLDANDAEVQTSRYRGMILRMIQYELYPEYRVQQEQEDRAVDGKGVAHTHQKHRPSMSRDMQPSLDADV